MAFNPHFHHRQSIRLRDYDYAQQGAYFITVCTAQKLPTFGHVMDVKMVLNDMGDIVHSTWMWLSEQYDYVQLDEFVVMPNHVHGIIFLHNTARKLKGDKLGLMNSDVINHAPTEDGCVGAQFIAPKSRTIAPNKNMASMVLGEIVRAYKARCTYAIHKIPGMEQTPIWQRNYYERIVRNETGLENIREYIVNNPMQWALDKFYVV